MLKTIIKYCFLGCFLTYSLGCTKWDLDRVDFTDVTIETKEAVQLNFTNSVIVSCAIFFSDLNKENPLPYDRGFQLSLDESFSILEDTTIVQDFTNEVSSFQDQFDNIENGIRYYYRGYANIQGKLLFGETKSFFLNWIKLADAPEERVGATSIVIDGNGYIIAGQNESELTEEMLQFNAEDKTWTTLSSFSFFLPQSHPLSFQLNDKVYMGMGQVLDIIDPNTPNYFLVGESNSNPLDWNEVFEFNGSPRFQSVSLISNGEAFILTGKYFNNFFNEVWAFTPPNSFEQRNPFPGEGRSEAVSFSIGDDGYIGLGTGENGSLSDFWKFNGTDFEEIEAFGGGTRTGAIAFSVDGKGYAGMGVSSSGFENDIWEYDPNLGWSKVTEFPGSPRANITVMVIDNTAYFGLGNNQNEYFKDWWAYTPEN